MNGDTAVNNKPATVVQAMHRILDHRDLQFFLCWLRNPLQVGAVCPSGAALARRMSAQVDPRRPGTVVELGGGTGAITQALLRRGIAPEKLIVIERDERLHRLLTTRFPHVAVLLGDAVHVLAELRRKGATRVSTVLSGLPLSLMSERQQRAVLDAAFDCMGDDGVFVLFTYGPAPPVPRSRLARWALAARPAGTAWPNVPPATVWRITKASAAVPAKASRRFKPSPANTGTAG